MLKLLLFKLLAVLERPPFSHLSASAIRGAARALRLDAALVGEFDILLRDYPVQYAGAMLLTLGGLKLGLPVHVFNLNGFIQSPPARTAAARLLRKHLERHDGVRSRRAQRLIRQALLLENREADDAEVLDRLEEEELDVLPGHGSLSFPLREVRSPGRRRDPSVGWSWAGAEGARPGESRIIAETRGVCQWLRGGGRPWSGVPHPAGFAGHLFPRGEKGLCAREYRLRM